MNGFDTSLLTIDQAAGLFLQNKQQTSLAETNVGGLSFQDILNEKSQTDTAVRFSKHANTRLESRQITLSDGQRERLNQGVNMARNKNINESLVMMDNLAFIVNVKNNTVITALQQGEDNNVFTNIDGAVIV